MEAKYLVPNSTIQLIIQEMSQIFHIENLSFNANFSNKLKELHLSDEQIEQILKSATESSSLMSVLNQTSGIYRSRFV